MSDKSLVVVGPILCSHCGREDADQSCVCHVCMRRLRGDPSATVRDLALDHAWGDAVWRVAVGLGAVPECVACDKMVRDLANDVPYAERRVCATHRPRAVQP